MVGTIGFLVDGGVLVGLLRITTLGPYIARVASFAVAVICTYLLNRGWTFGIGRREANHRRFGRYLAVQGLGAAVNYGAFAFAIGSSPPFARFPLAALALGALAGLTWNYIGQRFLVFQ
jgi:putative flippase GtrA